MKKIILILVMLAIVAIGINAAIPNPEEVGRGYRIEQKANADAVMAVVKADEASKLASINVDTARAAMSEKIAAQKLEIWALAYAKVMLIIVGVIAVAGVGFAIAIFALNLAVAYSRRAHYVARQLPKPARAGRVMPQLSKPVKALPVGEEKAGDISVFFENMIREYVRVSRN